jgi:hypothetical protein
LKHESTILTPIVEKGVSRLDERLDTCTHYLIIGDIGTAKTSLGCSIIDKYHKKTRKPIFVYRSPKPGLFPSWVKPLTDFKELPQGAVVLIDEASRYFDQFSYRKSGNQELAEIMRLARQNDQTVILIAHTSTILNPNLVLPIAVYLLKQPTMFQRFQERPMIRQAYKKIEKLRRIDEFHSEPIHKDEYYWLDSQTLEKETFTKAEWFSEEISKAYSGSTVPSPSTSPVAISHARAQVRRFIEPQPTRRFQPPIKNQPSVRLGVRLGSLSRLTRRFHRSGRTGVSDPSIRPLATLIGLIGLFGLLKGAWTVAALCLPVAFLAAIASTSRFGGN